MPDTKAWESVEAGATWTYQNKAGQAQEVIHVEVPADMLGAESGYSPVKPFVSSIGNQLRGGYCMQGNKVIAQLPRRPAEIQAETQLHRDAQLEFIYQEDGRISVIYQASNGAVTRLSWDVPTDSWTIETVEEDVVNDKLQDETVDVLF